MRTRKQWRKIRTSQPQGFVYFDHEYNTWVYTSDSGAIYPVSPQEARELVDGGALVFIGE
jgi:hypothetical protein